MEYSDIGWTETTSGKLLKALSGNDEELYQFGLALCDGNSNLLIEGLNEEQIKKERQASSMATMLSKNISKDDIAFMEQVGRFNWDRESATKFWMKMRERRRHGSANPRRSP